MSIVPSLSGSRAFMVALAAKAGDSETLARRPAADRAPNAAREWNFIVFSFMHAQRL
jgi:hypothetical protein